MTRRQRSAGQAVDLREDPPWGEPVDGTALVREVEDFLSQYVVLPPGGSLAVATWALSTFVMTVFDAHPPLVVTSPDRKCGKTRLLEVLELQTHRPVRATGMSEAALFRIVATASPTLLIDEAQSLRQRDERSAALHDLLCAANRRGSFVLRVGGPDRDRVEKFSVFGPKALAAIGSLAPVIMDRAIQIPMRRRKPGERVSKFFFDRAEADAAPIRRRIVRWATDHRDAVADIYRTSTPPDFLQDREAESWASLFAIGAAADPGLLPRLEEAARLLTGAKVDTVVPATGVRLLADIRLAFDESGEERLATRTLLETLCVNPEWSEWRRGRPLTEKALADLLRPFRIRPVQWRVGEARERGYRRTDFEDAWDRYEEPSSPVTVTGRKEAQTPPQMRVSQVVTDQILRVGETRFPDQALAALGVPADAELLELVSRSGEEVRRSPERLDEASDVIARTLQNRGVLTYTAAVRAVLAPLVQQAVAIFNGEIVEVRDAPAAPIPTPIGAQPVTTRDTQSRRRDSHDLQPVTNHAGAEVLEPPAEDLKW